MNLKPTQPLNHVPAGYVVLEGYSTLGRYWEMLQGIAERGLVLHLQRGDTEEVCRRKISGLVLPRAGRLLDVDKLLHELQDGFATADPLLQFLVGNPEPIQNYLSSHYVLRIEMVLAFGRMRELLLKYQAEYHPIAEEKIANTRFFPKRFSRDELRFMLFSRVQQAQ